MGNSKTPKLMIHGGAGSLEGNVPAFSANSPEERSRLEALHQALTRIAREGYHILLQQSAWDAVLATVSMLEDDPLFNAGTGARLQEDGQARLSAGLMDGTDNRFSGVINLTEVRNPIQVAARLSAARHTVLAGELATAYARTQGFARYNPVTEQRLAEHQARLKGRSGTVGAVALGQDGRIVAGTSTGGIGGEIPGRASDCPTTAGTYASTRAGVSCTGIGEQIINTAAATRVVTRVDDGLPLGEAVQKTMAEAAHREYRFGLIALDHQGNTQVGTTPGVGVLYAIHDGTTVETFFSGK